MRSSEKAIRLTKTDVNALVADPAGTRFYPVTGYKGLCLQVTKAGAKSFVLRYRFNGRQKIHTMGTFPAMTPDAAGIAHSPIWTLINAGTDPGQAKADARAAAAAAKRGTFTVSDLADRYFIEHTPTLSPKWAKESTRLIKKDLLPTLGKMPLALVGPPEVSALLFKLRKTPRIANIVRAVFHTMLDRAEEWGLRPTGSNPVSVVKKRAPEMKRTIRLTDMELKALGLTLKASEEAPKYILAVRLALLAGMRKGEIQALRWEWIDLDAGEIHIPPAFHKTGKKTGKTRVVHLCNALLAHIRALTPTLGCPYVVPGLPLKDKKGKEGKIIGWKPIIGLQGPWERIREAAKLATQGEPTEEDPGWHDLRRTFASVGADLGLKGFVGELLGHAEASVTDIYTRTAAEPLHDAAEKIGARIEGILTGKIDPEKELEARRKAQAKARKKAGA